jgi:AraC-like DNA-binding protein
MVRHRMEVDRAGGTFEASVHRARIGCLDLLRFAHGAPTRIISAPLDGFVTVHVPRRGTLEVIQRGRGVLVAPGAAAVISTGSPVEMTWSADHDLLVVKIPEAALRQQLADLTDGPVGSPLIFDLLHRLDARSAVAGAVELALRAVSERVEVIGALASFVTQSVVTGLLLGHPHSLDEEIWSARPLPSGIVRAVIDAVRADPGGEHTTRRLGELVGVSERTLQLAFNRHAGTTPTAYVRKIRLELARERLIAARGHGTVLDIAVQCGFSHAGRFAATYRERFGEAPSATLQRAR